jgi:glycosyltransferase involved in cell wall biosynthesis
VEGLVHALHESGTPAPVIHLDWEGFRPRRSTGGSGERITELCVRGANFARGPLKHRAGFYVRKRVAAAALDALVEAEGIRVAHFHYVGFGMEVLMQLAREAGLGVVTTFHGSDVNVLLQAPETEALVREMIALSDRVVAVSRALADRLLESAPSAASRTSVIYNSIPTNLVRLAAEDRGTAPERPAWDGLFVGKLIERKGGDVLLDAAARVAREFPDLRLALAGSGEEEGPWREQARRLGIGDNVVFLGELRRGDLLDAYRRARVIVAPSRAEGLPLILFESQWLGVPTVATAVGGIPELVEDGENGFLVPADDPEATAAAWLRLLRDDALRRAMGARATALARERFAPSVMAEAYQRLYDGIGSAQATVIE